MCASVCCVRVFAHKGEVEKRRVIRVCVCVCVCWGGISPHFTPTFFFCMCAAKKKQNKKKKRERFPEWLLHQHFSFRFFTRTHISPRQQAFLCTCGRGVRAWRASVNASQFFPPHFFPFFFLLLRLILFIMYLDALLAEGDARGEEARAGHHIRLHKSALLHVLVAAHRAQNL